MDFFYRTAIGRALLLFFFHSGLLGLAARWLESGRSRWYIQKYIKKNHIDMKNYKGRPFASFAEFFERREERVIPQSPDNCLISPCDGLLSVYPVTNDSRFRVKGSLYRTVDIVPDRELAESFEGGLCMVFRLQAADYHHFCYIDDCQDTRPVLIPGTLHSVQPVALEKEPVFRLNRRYYHLLKTKNFGPVLQAEVGAVLVGDVVHKKSPNQSSKGEEAGYFRLCGSSILLFFDRNFRQRFSFFNQIREMTGKGLEYPVKMGQELGCLSGDGQDLVPRRQIVTHDNLTDAANK